MKNNKKYIVKDSWKYKEMVMLKIIRAMKEVGYEPWMGETLFKMGISI